jgi:GDP/UDP-N,N'-diacetylbacillosamine 2-epimerase (hydrolysing)
LRGKKKIAVVTGSRSEYGVLYNILRRIESSPNLHLSLIATGAHLSQEFGYTIDEVLKDGFRVAERVEMLVSSDSPEGVGKSIGLGVIGFVDCFKRIKPDILLVLGDRYEIFAAATAAMAVNLPIAHISGGDITEGLIDEPIRHAVTKISHLHFVALKRHAQRVMQMGEEPWRVHVVGEPCIDNIKNMEKISRGRLEKALGTDLPRPTVLVTFHPVTLQPEQTAVQMKNLLDVLDRLDAKLIFTYPNADAGGREIISEIKRFIKSRTNAVAFKSLGARLYLNLLSHVDLIVGNSSSAIVEAPSFRLPAVNIGIRQEGRLFPKNVICTSEKTNAILRAVRKAMSPDFKKSISRMKNPYDRGGASDKIVKILSTVEMGPRLLIKKFIDVKR